MSHKPHLHEALIWVGIRNKPICVRVNGLIPGSNPYRAIHQLSLINKRGGQGPPLDPPLCV